MWGGKRRTTSKSIKKRKGKKKKTPLFFFSRGHRRVGASRLRHVDERRQVEPERPRRGPRRVDARGARHGLPREDPQPGPVDVEEGLRAVAARPAEPVGRRRRRGPPRNDRPRVRRGGVSRGRHDPVRAADPREEGLELVEPLEEGREHAELGRGGGGVFGEGLRVRNDARLAEQSRGVGVRDRADLPARDAAFVGGVVDDGALCFFFVVSYQRRKKESEFFFLLQTSPRRGKTSKRTKKEKREKLTFLKLAGSLGLYTARTQ